MNDNFRELQYRTRADNLYVEELEGYFNSGLESSVIKLENFAKYVPRQTLTRFLVKYELFKKVLNIHGSIIECGVLFGGGLMIFAQLSAILEPLNHTRKIIGFDTFSGFSRITKEDKRSKSHHLRKGGYGVDSYDDLLRCIELYDLNRHLGHIGKVSLVKGDIKKTMPRYLKGNPHTVVSLLYLDVDVFEPTKVALECLVPRIPKGGIIVFDELNSENWPGETTAVMQTLGIPNLKIERFSFDTCISYAVME